MRRALVFALALALFGCKRPNPPPPEKVSPTPTAAGGALQPSAATTLDPKQLDAYVAYEKSLLEVLPKRLAEYQQAVAAMKQSAGEPAQGAQAIAAASELAKDIDQDKAELQKKSGLSAEAIRGWDALTGEVLSLRQGAETGPLAKMNAAAHERAAKLPPEQRKVAEKQLEPVDEQLARQRTLADQRAEFGDAAVNAVLAREAELSGLHAKRLELLRQMSAAADSKPRP